MGFWIAVLAILVVAAKYGRKSSGASGTRGTLLPEEKFRNANRGACPADTFPQGAIPRKGAAERQAIVKPPPLRTPLAKAKAEAVSTRERVAAGAGTAIPVILTHTIAVPEGQKYIGRGFLPIPIQKCPPPTLRARPPLSATPAKPMPAPKVAVAPKPVAFRSQPQPAPTAAPAKPVAKPAVTTIPAESLQGLIVRFVKWIGLSASVVLLVAAPTFAQVYQQVQLAQGQAKYNIYVNQPWTRLSTTVTSVFRFTPLSSRPQKVWVVFSNLGGTNAEVTVDFWKTADPQQPFSITGAAVANGWSEGSGVCGNTSAVGGFILGAPVATLIQATNTQHCIFVVGPSAQVAITFLATAAMPAGNFSATIFQVPLDDLNLQEDVGGSGDALPFFGPELAAAPDNAIATARPGLLTSGVDATTGRAEWFRVASASNTGNPTSQPGIQLGEKSGRWQATSNPAAGSQATASRAAGAAGVRHVADCISFSAASTTAPVATALTVNLRDGATGAGTIIWTYQVVALAATGQNVVPHSVCGLNLIGTAATAMTLEFSAALANLIEAVSLSGYSVN